MRTCRVSHGSPQAAILGKPTVRRGVKDVEEEPGEEAGLRRRQAGGPVNEPGRSCAADAGGRSQVIVGILSDTHGELQRTRVALRVLERVGATVFIHCGDVGAGDLLAELAGRRAWVVAGNTDFFDGQAVEYAAGLGLTLSLVTPLRVELAGRGLAVYHGHEPQFRDLLECLRRGQSVPDEVRDCGYVVHGHTHIAAHTRLAGRHLLNPGALHRATRYTVATVDLAADRVRFWDLSGGDADCPPRPFTPGR